MPVLTNRQWKKFSSKNRFCLVYYFLIVYFLKKRPDSFLFIISKIIFINFSIRWKVSSMKSGGFIKLYYLFPHSIRIFIIKKPARPRRVKKKTNRVLGRTYSYLLPIVELTIIRHNIINSSVSEIWNLPLLEDRSMPIPSTNE